MYKKFPIENRIIQCQQQKNTKLRQRNYILQLKIFLINDEYIKLIQ